MLSRTICVLGEPGAGKTTLVHGILAHLKHRGATFETFYSNTALDGRKLNPITGRIYRKEGIIVWGDYQDDQPLYGGTDRFGLNCIPVAPKAIQDIARSADRYTLLFEGDRLSKLSVLQAAQDYADVLCLYLRVSPQISLARRQQRADDEWVKSAGKSIGGRPRRADRADGISDSWLKGRRTNVTKLSKAFPTIVCDSDYPDAGTANVHLLEHLLGLCACESEPEQAKVS